jgi:hypothetical protein
LPLPDGLLVSFGVAGALVGDLAPGDLVTASRVVNPEGTVLWEGEPLVVRGARPVVVAAVEDVVDDPQERGALARGAGAAVADLESGRLAASGRLVGVVRAVSDSAAHPVGRVARAARTDGATEWRALAVALLLEPRRSAAAIRNGRRALASLELAAAELARA